MTEFETKRDPRIPPMPNKTDWQKFERIEQWRRSNLTIIRQLHADTYNDLHTLANESANNANDIANNANDIANNANDIANLEAIDPDANISGAITLFPWEFTYQQGGWVWQTNANQKFGGYYHNGNASNGDYISSNYVIPAGNYRVHLDAVTGANRGIVSFSASYGSLGTFDLYSASTTYNYANYFHTAILGGVRRLVLSCQSKNASSSGYIASISKLSLHRYS